MEEKNIAFEYAIWLNQNRWFNFDEKYQKWCYTFEHGTAISRNEYEKYYMKTNDELWVMFINKNK